LRRRAGRPAQLTGGAGGLPTAAPATSSGGAGQQREREGWRERELWRRKEKKGEEEKRKGKDGGFGAMAGGASWRRPG